MDLACAVRHGHRPPLLAEPKTTAHVPGSESARPCPALAGTDALAPMTWAQQGQGTVVPTPRLSHRKEALLSAPGVGAATRHPSGPDTSVCWSRPGATPATEHVPRCTRVCTHTHAHTPCTHACMPHMHTCTHMRHTCTHISQTTCMHAHIHYTCVCMRHMHASHGPHVHSCTCMHHICVHLPQTTCVRAHIHHTHVRVPHVHATRVPAPRTPHTQRPASSPAAPSLPRHERPCGWHASAPRGHLLGAPLHPTLSADKRPALRPQV